MRERSIPSKETIGDGFCCILSLPIPSWMVFLGVRNHFSHSLHLSHSQVSLLDFLGASFFPLGNENWSLNLEIPKEGNHIGAWEKGLDRRFIAQVFVLVFCAEDLASALEERLAEAEFRLSELTQNARRSSWDWETKPCETEVR